VKPYWQYSQQNLRLAHFTDADLLNSQLAEFLSNFMDKPKRNATKVAIIFKLALCLSDVAIEVKNLFMKHSLSVIQVSGLMYSSAQIFIDTYFKNDPVVKHEFDLEIDSCPYFHEYSQTNFIKFKIAVITSNLITFERFKKKVMKFPHRDGNPSFIVHGIIVIVSMVSKVIQKIDPKTLISGYDGILYLTDYQDDIDFLRTTLELLKKIPDDHPILFAHSLILREKNAIKTVEDTAIGLWEEFKPLGHYLIIHQHGDDALLPLIELAHISMDKTKLKKRSKVKKKWITPKGKK